MKLPQLLSQFLYQTKRLDLPGIGTFTLDAAAVIPQDADRLGHVPASGIHFQNVPVPAADDALITFIKDHTGKMKSLAAADLDFHLTTGRQLLNIGKPFYLEGIGTLLKTRDGRLEFTPGEYLVARLDDLSERKGAAPAMGYDEPPREEPSGNNARQTLLLLGLLVGLIVIGWGGYYLYKRNNYTEPAPNQARVIPESTATQARDTTALAGTATDSIIAGKKDTTLANAGAKAANPPDASAMKPATDSPAKAAVNPAAVQFMPTPGAGQSLYNFVILRTENKHHALRRYNQLLGYQLNIHMETKDSSFFKLYFPIAAAVRDTARIRDSLADVYAARVSIEQH